MIGLIPEAASAEPPPETKTIRLIYDPDDGGALCYAPTWVAADLLRAEGFTDVRFVKMIEKTNVEPPTLAAGQADMSGVFGPDLIMGVDAGLPVVGLAGLHGGCLELVGSERVRTIRDLNGKKIAVSALGVTDHLFIANMLAYIGMNPRKDVQWVVHEPPESIRLLAQGKVDALLAFPPMPQQLRAKKIGHVLLRTAEDPPWSQYICCMLVASKQFVQNSPVATKRAIRAVLKSVSSACRSRSDPPASSWTRSLRWEQATRRRSRRSRTCATVPCGVNTTRNPRSSSTRCACGRMASSRARRRKIIAQGTDWRFLAELKKELKG